MQTEEEFASKLHLENFTLPVSHNKHANNNSILQTDQHKPLVLERVTVL